MNNWTPLHLAAQKGHLDVVEYLVNQKAEINSKDNQGKTPLGIAYGRAKEFLKSKGGE